MNNYPLLVFLLFCFNHQSIGQELTQSAEMDKYCHTPQQQPDDIYENGYLIECDFANANIPVAFERYKQLDSEDRYNLVKKLVPNKNIKVKCSQGGCIEADYYWPNSKQLEISLMFEGGETLYKFIEQSEGTKLEIRMFPD